MRYTLRLALLAASFGALTTLKAQVAKPDDMVRKIFSALQTKDEKAFVTLYPNAPQFTKMMRSLMEVMRPQMEQMMTNMGDKSQTVNMDSIINAEVDKMSKPEEYAQMQEKFASTYKKIIEKGEKKGVNWSSVKLVNFTIDTTAKATGDMAMMEQIGLKVMKGVMDIQSEGKDYQMSFDKVIYLPTEDGWFGGEFPQLARKGESLEPDADTEAMTKDSVDSVAASRPVKTKTKTKSSGAKTKTKTTSSPARKPRTTP